MCQSLEGFDVETIVEKLLELIDEEPKGYVPGSKLSIAIRASNPECFPDSNRAQRRHDQGLPPSKKSEHKGWMRKLAAENTDRITQVDVDNWKEPCYCRAGSEVGTPAQPPVEMVRPIKDAAISNMLKREHDGEEEGEPGEAKRQKMRLHMTPDEAAEKLAEHGCEGEVADIRRAAVEVLSADERGCGYMEGSKLSQALLDMARDSVEKVKAVLQKGWIKNTLAGEDSVEEVSVAGIDEPCFKIVGAEIHILPKEPRSSSGGKKRGQKGGKDSGKSYGKGHGKDYGKGYGKDYGKGYGKDYGKAGMSWNDMVAISHYVTSMKGKDGKGKGKNSGWSQW